jgi:hypothetical protein
MITSNEVAKSAMAMSRGQNDNTIFRADTWFSDLGSLVIFIYPAFPGFRKAAVRPAAAAPEKPPGTPSTHQARLAHAAF